MNRKLRQFVDNGSKWLNESAPYLLILEIVLFHFLLLSQAVDQSIVKEINRWVGFLTAFLGIGFVFYGLHKRMTEFNVGSIRVLLLEWIQRPFNLWPPVLTPISVDTVINVESVAAASASVSEVAVITSLEQKIEKINKQMNEIVEHIAKDREYLKKQIESANKKAEESIEELRKELDKLGNSIRENAVGSLSLEISGAMIALYSLIVTSFFQMP